MVAIQIRDVPADVGDALAQRAHARGQSMQAFLLALVTAEAKRSANLKILARFAERSDGSQLSAEQATRGLTEARTERTPELTDPSLVHDHY